MSLLISLVLFLAPDKGDALRIPEQRMKTALRSSCKDIDSIVKESKIKPGIIMTGQGGSATRAAQQIVKFAGTHDFGRVDRTTKDSWALREGHAFGYMNVIMKEMGSVTFLPKDLPKHLHEKISENVCKSFKIIKADREKSKAKLPWAVKEPWVRVELPCFDEVIDYKLVHVTRDIRCIHNTHGDERWNNTFVEEQEDINAIASYAELLNNHSTTAFNKTALQVALQSASSLFHSLELGKSEYGIDDVSRMIKFAHVWGFMELSIFKSWTQEKSERYFHMAEPNYRTRSSAIELAKFLGNADPDESTLKKMMGVWYGPKDPPKDHHWHIMQKIIHLPESNHVLEALRVFGYEHYEH